MSKWLELLKTLGPVVIAATVPHGAVIAPVIIQAIAEAEAIRGASGPDKLAHVVTIAGQAAEIAKEAGVKLEPSEVTAAATNAINATVGVVNIVHKAQAPPTT